MIAYQKWLQKWKQTKDNVQAGQEKKYEEKILRKKEEDKKGFGK